MTEYDMVTLHAYIEWNFAGYDFRHLFRL